MRRTILTTLLATLATAAPLVASADEQPKRTYALIVANNSSVDPGVEPLRFADDDGARFYELFDSMVDEAYLLTTLDDDSQRVFKQLASKTKAPTKENLDSRVAALAAKIDAEQKAGVQTEVYLVFTGHGNVDDGGEGYLSLGDQKLRRSDLQRDVIGVLGADYTHLIIDACHAYFMVRARGGGEWKDDRSGESLDSAFNAYLSGRKQASAMPTVGVILSTAGTAEVHEWSKFRGGVFSHQLRSGLLGAADADGDGNVTYRELEAYLVAANVAVTNPRARIKVFAEPPAQDRKRALTSIKNFRDSAKLVIPQGVGGRYHIEDGRGLRYADMNVDPAAQTQVVLLQKPVAGGGYFLRTDVAQAAIPSGGAEVRSPQLAFVERKEQSRGSVEESFRTSLFATPFGPAFVQGYTAGRESLESTQQAVVPAPAPVVDRWSNELSLDYALGTAPLGLGGLQHHLSLGFVWLHDSGIALGPYLGYGFADTSEGQFHRVSAGLELDKFFGDETWRVGPRFRLGHQGLFLNAPEFGLAADPVGLRGEASIVAIRAAGAGVSFTVHGGASIDVATQSDESDSNEQVELNPFIGVGTRF